jgi:hypothetical protein
MDRRINLSGKGFIVPAPSMTVLDIVVIVLVIPI